MRTLLASSVLVALLSATAYAFSDVPFSHDHSAAIAYVQEQGIVNGYSDGTYRPEGTINRAEFVKILIEATGGVTELEHCKIAPFPDVEYSSWYATYVLEAQCRGVIGGYPDGTFRPAASVSLAEAAKIIVVAMKYDHEESEQSWYRGYTDVLAARHALPTDLDSVSTPLTRGIMAEMIYRLKAGKTDLPSYSADDVEEAHTMMSSSSAYTGLLPLGDQKYSTSPKKGYIYSCQTRFNGSGAFRDGDWIQGDSWDPTKKPVVDGSNTWSNATFSIALKGDTRVITGNGLPVDDPTGNYPVRSTDDAYQYDRNPNSVKTQAISLSLPASPVLAASPSCVPMGLIGVAVNGVAIFNGFDAEGRDAAAHEILDLCQGHPQQQGMYHYHAGSTCLNEGSGGQSALIGYALDGFGIYGRYDQNGNELTSADLDECHGITSPVEWNGEIRTMYHYVLTRDYPYSIACFKGTPVNTGNLGNDAMGGRGEQQNQSGQNAGGAPKPPQEAITACNGKSTNVSCSFSGGSHTVSGVCRNTPDGSVACVP